MEDELGSRVAFFRDKYRKNIYLSSNINKHINHDKGPGKMSQYIYP